MVGAFVIACACAFLLFVVAVKADADVNAPVFDAQKKKRRTPSSGGGIPSSIMMFTRSIRRLTDPETVLWTRNDLCVDSETNDLRA